MPAFVLPATGQRIAASPPGLLIPMGGGYTELFTGFAAAALGRARDGRATIVLLPTPFSSSAVAITPAERERNLADAEKRRRQLEEACGRMARAGISCRVLLAPIFTRADAYDPAALAAFAGPVAAVFIVGGDQTVAMQVLAGTPAEAALARIHAEGAVIGGTSAGASMLASPMLAGTAPALPAARMLERGAVEVWGTRELRGLPFGVPGALIDQHFFQRGRLPRLMNAITAPGNPGLGIGIDAHTGLHVCDCLRIEEVFGLYAAAILDAETYHAAAAARHRGPRGILSARNILVHLLAPGTASYDLPARRHSLAAPAPQPARRPFGLRSPSGAGALLLAGGLSRTLPGSGVLARFAGRIADRLAAWDEGEDASRDEGRSGSRVDQYGRRPKVVIYADGYLTERGARAAAEQYRAALLSRLPRPLRATIQTRFDRVAGHPLPAERDMAGLVLLGEDASRVNAGLLRDWVARAWLSGVPLLADNAMAAVMGKAYVAHGSTPARPDLAELATQRSLLDGETTTRPGLGLVDVLIVPELIDDNRWARFFALAFGRPDLVALGLSHGGALEIGPDGGAACRESALITLDLRDAALALGANRAFVIANGLLDVFAPGDGVEPTS